MYLHEIPRSKKRQRHSFKSLSEHLCEDSSSFAKRQQRTLQLYISHCPPGFRDGSSKVPLTREALREHNRRTSHLPNIIPPPALTRSIKRFARHGGPDLTDIRGVSTLHSILRARIGHFTNRIGIAVS